jgi:GAF domain-containing protein
MLDQDRLLDVLTRFSRTLASRYDVSDVLYELSDSVVDVLGASGAGVSLADEAGRLCFATATDGVVAVLEEVQEATQDGPCRRAFQTNEAVFSSDLRTIEDWPEVRETALRHGLLSVAGIPMALAGSALGSLNIYDRNVRTWSADDIAAARVFADMATSYIAHASELDRARRVNEQLQTALNSRVIIEQAKGILAGERRISLDEAFNILRQHARNHNARLRAVAHAVVELGMRP